MIRQPILLIFMMILAAAGVAAAAGEESAPPGKATDDLPAPVKALGIPNARIPAENLLTSGQPTQEHMTALRDLGYTTFISLRPAQEPGTGWEEKFSEDNRIRFVRIPIAGPDDLTRANAERLSEGIAQAGPGKVVLSCASSNRVGALLALKASTIDGMGAEESLALGIRSGLKGLEPKVRSLLGLPPPPAP